MAESKFRRYMPGMDTYSRRRTDEEWQEHRQFLTGMHDQRYTRREMISGLKLRDFHVTIGQLLAQMKKWDLTVYNTANGSHAPTFRTTPELEDPNAGTCVEGLRQAAAEPMYDHDPADDTAVQVDAGFMGGLFLANQSDNDISSDLGLANDSLTTLVPSETLRDFITGEQKYIAGEDEAKKGRPDLDADTWTEAEGIEYDSGRGKATPQGILQQLRTITELWCDPFPRTCCCQSLFFSKDRFARSSGLYAILLEQSSSSTLQYVWALLSLIELSPAIIPTPHMQAQLWQTIEYYLRLCTKVDIKNSLANQILHRLLKAWQEVSGDQAPFPTSAFTSSRSSTNPSLFTKIFSAKPANSWSSVTACHRNVDWQNDSDRDVGMLVGFAARQPSTFPLINWSGTTFGSTGSWSNTNDMKDNYELITTAALLATHMEHIWSICDGSTNGKDIHPKPVVDAVDCDLPMVFNALGLMLALELSSYVKDLMQQDGKLSDPASWPKELHDFVDSTLRTLSLNAEYAEKFRRSYWLVKTDKIGYGGKGIHMGDCLATNEWQVLNRDIHEYDEERTWIERRLFSGRNTWPQANDLVNGDNMSMRSVSSFNSFRRFQALAFHLKIGTPHSRSTRTKSTKSKMSLDSHLSWRLEHLLEIKEHDEAHGSSDEREALSSTQHAEQDQQAFETIQSIEQ